MSHIKSHRKSHHKLQRKLHSKKHKHSKKCRSYHHHGGGNGYAFDTNDMIGGLPAVTTYSQCGGKRKSKQTRKQRGGFPRDNLRFDVLRNLKK